MKHSFLAVLAAVLGLGPAGRVAAQPEPGDVFREYLWRPDTMDAGGALRVGGQHGESHPDRGSDHGYTNAPVRLSQPLDLGEAIRGEVVIEKLLCHDGTRGLAIQVNGGEWMAVPEAEKIPAPQCDYQHHICPVVPIPMAHLKAGLDNVFRLRVSPEHPWAWPQNLIYGVHVRIYYDPLKKPHPAGRLTSPKPGQVLGRSVELEAAVSSSNGRIRQVDFLGLHDDVNLEGDGEYRRWHYRYFHGALTNHIGTVTAEPFKLTWDTSWVPDQSQPMKIGARITDETGLTYFTEAAEGLQLDRPGLSVELCRPGDVPKKWVTRSGEKEEKFTVAGDVSKAAAAQLVWSSWSPGYMNGIYLNGRKVFDREGPRYACYVHRVTLPDLTGFVPGVNILKTGLTPKYNGQTVHGMEVNWPGIMVLIQYRE